MMRATIMPDQFDGQGEGFDPIRKVRTPNPNRTVRVEMTLFEAQKVARAADAFDDLLSDAEGAFKFLGQALRTGDISGDYDLACVLTLCGRGMVSPERDEDYLRNLAHLLRTEPPEAAPEGAQEKGESDDDQ